VSWYDILGNSNFPISSQLGRLVALIVIFIHPATAGQHRLLKFSEVGGGRRQVAGLRVLSPLPPEREHANDDQALKDHLKEWGDIEKVEEIVQ